MVGKTFLILPLVSGRCVTNGQELTDLLRFSEEFTNQVQVEVPSTPFRQTYPRLVPTPNPIRASVGLCLGRNCAFRIPIIPFTITGAAVSVESGTEDG